MEDIYNMLLDGISTREIRNMYPSQYIRYSNKIREIEQELLEEKYGTIFRHLDVIYIYMVKQV